MAREKGMGNLQQEKSGRWTMRVGVNGTRYSQSTRTKDREKAERALQRFLSPLGLGERRLPLADVWREYVRSPNRNELAKATLDGKRQVWMLFAKWMERFYLPIKDLNGVTADIIAEYLAFLRADLCGTTYNNRVCVLREIFRTLAAKAGLADDPWEGVRLRPDDSHSRRELTKDELQRLLEAAGRQDERDETAIAEEVPCPSSVPCSSHEWRLLFLLGIYTGLRLGDCCRLDWADVNLDIGVIQVVPQKTRRHAHGHPVTIPIHPTLSAVLRTCQAKSGGPVLPTVCALYRQSRSKVSEALARIFREAKITMSVKLEGRKRRTPEASFHSLRHTFVSFAANAGIPLHFVQSIVGHESTAMTRHYYHEDEAGLRRAVAAIPAFGISDIKVCTLDETHAVCSRRPGTPGAGSRSAAERLCELESLKASKTITVREYRVTRARILGEL